jgi:hypothetical protein
MQCLHQDEFNSYKLMSNGGKQESFGLISFSEGRETNTKANKMEECKEGFQRKKKF